MSEEGEGNTGSLAQRMSQGLVRQGLAALARASKDDEAAYAVIWVVMTFLRVEKIPPKPLHDFFLKVLDHPVRYSTIMSHAKPPKRRGRPSIDDKHPDLLPRGLRQKRFFGRLPTEKNAMMISYLLHEGYLINEAGKYQESAVELLSPIVKRSHRALQNDYYKHKSKVQTESAISLGKATFRFQKFLHEKYRRR